MKLIGKFTMDIPNKKINTWEGKGYHFEVVQETDNVITVEIFKKGRLRR